MKKSYQIHPTAIVAPGVTIGNNVIIEPYAVINSPHVILEDQVVIKSHAYIDGHTTIGSGTTIYPGASIGTKTQDLKYRGEKTFVKSVNIVKFENLPRLIPHALKIPQSTLAIIV